MLTHFCLVHLSTLHIIIISFFTNLNYVVNSHNSISSLSCREILRSLNAQCTIELFVVSWERNSSHFPVSFLLGHEIHVRTVYVLTRSSLTPERLWVLSDQSPSCPSWFTYSLCGLVTLQCDLPCSCKNDSLFRAVCWEGFLSPFLHASQVMFFRDRIAISLYIREKSSTISPSLGWSTGSSLEALVESLYASLNLMNSWSPPSLAPSFLLHEMKLVTWWMQKPTEAAILWHSAFLLCCLLKCSKPFSL